MFESISKSYLLLELQTNSTTRIYTHFYQLYKMNVSDFWIFEFVAPKIKIWNNGYRKNQKFPNFPLKTEYVIYTFMRLISVQNCKTVAHFCVPQMRSFLSKRIGTKLWRQIFKWFLWLSGVERKNDIVGFLITNWSRFLPFLVIFVNLKIWPLWPDLTFTLGSKKMTSGGRTNPESTYMAKIAPKTCVTLFKCEPWWS